MKNDLSEDALKALNRIWQLTLIKDDPEDDEWDTLRKIGNLAHDFLIVHHPGVREAYEKAEAEKHAIREKDEAERRELWEQRASRKQVHASTEGAE